MCVSSKLNVNKFNSKKKRAKKRKATIPIGGASNKKIIESVSSSNSRGNSDEEMCSGNEDQQWESELMLKDPRWSVSKGVKDDSNVGKISLTPLIIRHNQSNKVMGSILGSCFTRLRERR